MQSTVAFLSHRSSHKDFVKKIVDVVKRDNCIVDEFDFYPTAKTADEKFKYITNFCLIDF